MPDTIFAGRTALVTGAARGIGRAVALLLARHGARVAVNYCRQAEAAAETLRGVVAAGVAGVAVQADVSQPEAVQAMVRQVREALGPIDLLVNNAGIVEHVSHGELDFAAWRRMLSVNLDGVFLTTWAVKDEMIARRYGRIVNISSLAGLVRKPHMIHYATSKAAVIAFTRSCSEAFAPYNIRVNCVAPGCIDTDMARQADPALVVQIVAGTPLGRIGTVDDVAAAVRFLLSDESDFITGQTLPVCGGRV
jgi:3-oxoacyl-[acyl-carrier protein] reductase